MPPRPERYAWSGGQWDQPPAMPWLEDWVALATGGTANGNTHDARQDRAAALAHADMTAKANPASDEGQEKRGGDVGRYAFLGGDGGGSGGSVSEALSRSRSLRSPALDPRQTPPPPPSAANLPFCVGPCMAFANIGDCGSHANFTCLCQSEVYVHSVMQCWAVRCNATGYNIAISYSASTCAALGVEMRLGANGASIDVTGAPVIFSKVAFNISAVMSSLCSLLLAGALVLGFFSCRAQARKHAALGSMATYPWMDTGKGRGRRTEEPVDMDASVDFYEMFAPPRRPATAATATGSGSSSSPDGLGLEASAAASAAPASNAPSTRANRFSNRDPILPGELDFSAFDGVVSDADAEGKARSPVSDKDWAEGGSDKSATASADDVVDALPVLNYLSNSPGYTVPDTPTTIHMAARESVPDSIGAATTAAAAESTTALNPVPAPYEAPPPLPPMPPPPVAAPPRTPPPPSSPPAAPSPASTPRPIPHPYTRSADSPGRAR